MAAGPAPSDDGVGRAAMIDDVAPGDARLRHRGEEPQVVIPHVDVGREFPVPASVAWRLLSDTRRWTSWGPTISDVELDPPVVTEGAHGRIRTSIGVWLPFEITEVVPGTRWAWRVLGIPATGHRVEVTPTGCRVVFEVPTVVAPYAAVCRVALRRMERLLAPGPGTAPTTG
jgi:hypothetical protein